MKTLSRDPRLRTVHSLIREYGPAAVLEEVATYLLNQAMVSRNSKLIALANGIDRLITRFQR